MSRNPLIMIVAPAIALLSLGPAIGVPTGRFTPDVQAGAERVHARMSNKWVLSARFLDFLGGLVKSSDFAATSADYYPVVGWSLGGTMEAPDGTITPIPPQYEVGLTRKDKVPAGKLRLPSKEFGIVIFDPKPEDAKSSRRLIDFDGTNIVVR